MPSFRIVVTEHTRGPKAGNFVEKVGTYNPKTKERNLNIERIKYWLSVGAKASGTMHNMLVSAGIVSGKKVNVLPRKSPPKKDDEQAKDPGAAVVAVASAGGEGKTNTETAPEGGGEVVADAGGSAADASATS